MTEIDPEAVRAFIIDSVADSLDGWGVSADEVPDDFDLLLEGTIDSFGLIELLVGLEARFNLSVDFEGLDAEELTKIGPLSRYVASQTPRISS